MKHNGDVVVDKIVKRASTNSDSLSEDKKMIEVGRLCVKIAGRDAGKKCVIVEVVDDKFVVVDGETRRRKCNVKHIEPLDETIDVKNGAHDVVVSEFKNMGIDLRETKPKQAKPRQKQLRSAERKKMAPKEVKKAEPKKAPVKKETAKPEEAVETPLEKAASEGDEQ